MSQEKVEKRKYEKKHRAQIMRKKRAKMIIGWAIFGIIAGCLLGATLGVKIYKSIPKFVEAEKLGAYVNEVWAENGYGNYFTSTSSDASEEADTSDDTEASDDADTSGDTEASDDADTSDDTEASVENN